MTERMTDRMTDHMSDQELDELIRRELMSVSCSRSRAI
jgi:hypothetical protein